MNEYFILAIAIFGSIYGESIGFTPEMFFGIGMAILCFFIFIKK